MMLILPGCPGQRQRRRHHNQCFSWILLLWMCITIATFSTGANSNNNNQQQKSYLFVQAQPSPALYFHHQIVDHVDPTGPYRGEEWTQRYYVSDKYFQGPGYPIFIIMGGEGDIPPEIGFKYPFVTEHLAKSLGAFVFQPEHRFYGESQPLRKKKKTTTTSTTMMNDEELSINLRNNNKNKNRNNNNIITESSSDTTTTIIDPRTTLFTSEQALYDAMTLLSLIQNQTHCSIDKFSKDYCPVITVGGSYPGFLAAFGRILFPNRIDMAYAASAPMKFYSQQVQSHSYYNHITKVAEETKIGCSTAIRLSLEAVQSAILHPDDDDNDSDETKEFDISRLGICPGSVPRYIPPTTTPEGRIQFTQELMMVVGYTFANDNMANYPPSTAATNNNINASHHKTTKLYQDCEIFSNCSHHPLQHIQEFLTKRLADDVDATCWDMSLQLPTGPHATISSGDWSGVGTGGNGESWDFQTCTLLVEAIGFAKGPESMFPHREWTMDWLTHHCQVRFGVTPQPYQLVNQWKFTEEGLLATNVTRILFTNGLKDGWSVGGIQTNLSESLLALNFPNGAHHSDLSAIGPSEDDTDDIRQGFQDVYSILTQWLEEIRRPVVEGTTI